MGGVEHPRMRGRFLPAAPVTCVACASDAFAVGETHEDALTTRVHLELRCGACGLWQQRSLDAATADRFLDHLAATQRQIARVLVTMLRAASAPTDL
jgi:hypothetical protein